MNKKVYRHIVAGLCMLLCASEAMANAPTVTLGGYAKFDGGFVNEKEPYKFDNLVPASEIGGGNRIVDSGFATSGFVNVGMHHKVSMMEYGAKIVFNVAASKLHRFTLPTMYENDISFDNLDSSVVEKAFAYVTTKYATLEAGSYEGAVNRLTVNAASLDAGTIGISGAIAGWINPMSPVNADALGDFDIAPVQVSYKFAPGLYVADPHYAGSAAYRANRVAVVSAPMGNREFGKLTIAAEYIPDTEVAGTTASFAQARRTKSAYYGAYRNALRGALRYDHTNRDMAIKASLAGEVATAKDFMYDPNVTLHKLRGCEFGAAVSYKNFTLAGAYGVAGKPGIDTNVVVTPNSNTKFWNAGIRWDHGPAGVSLTYSDTRRAIQDQLAANKARQVAFGVGYNLGKGATVSLEAIDLRLTDNQLFTPAAGTNRAQRYGFSIEAKF